MTSRVRIIPIPVHEALKINQCNALGGLAVQCIGVAGCPGPAVFRGLPVMINLQMNSAVTSGIFGCCAGRTVVGDNSGVIDVEGKIVECWPAVRSASVSRVIASRRVLKDGARSFDTVNLNKDSLLFPEIIGDGTGGTWRMPA